MEQGKNQSVRLDYKQGVWADGIADVASFDADNITLSLVEGGKLALSGENLKIIGFDKAPGEFKASGSVYSLKYSAGAKRGLKNLFK